MFEKLAAKQGRAEVGFSLARGATVAGETAWFGSSSRTTLGYTPWRVNITQHPNHVCMRQSPTIKVS